MMHKGGNGWPIGVLWSGLLLLPAFFFLPRRLLSICPSPGKTNGVLDVQISEVLLNRIRYVLALLLCIPGLEACGVLPARVVPTPLSIEQVQRPGRTAEYIFCDMEGGAWSCDAVSRKTLAISKKKDDSVSREDVPTIEIKNEDKRFEKREVVVFFDISSARVNRTQVAKIRDAISDIKSSSRISVAGYTDNTGPQEYNQLLSQRRANAIRRLLVQEGVAPEKIESVGKGKCCYIDDNRLAAGRGRNRRASISFQFLEKGHL